MKKVFTPMMVLASFLACANANAEALIVNDFNDGTPQGWHKGGAADTPITAVAGEGNGTGAQPIPVGNGYLKFVSEGPDADVSDKNITFMAGREWRGNYIAMGAKSITARMKVVDAPHDLEMHVAFGNTLAGLRTRFASAGVMVPNDGEWHDVAFSLTDGLHKISLGGHGKSSASFSLEETLANVAAVRFTQGKFGEVYFDRRGPFEGYNGPEKIKAELWIDDITLSTDEVAAGN